MLRLRRVRFLKASRQEARGYWLVAIYDRGSNIDARLGAGSVEKHGVVLRPGVF